MVAIYVNRIKEGIITIDEVPQRWRVKVEEELAK